MGNQKLTDADFELVASKLGVEKAVVMAVQAVETGGRGGFIAPGKPVVLFEGHIFWGQLKKYNLNPENYTEGNEDILYPEWTKQHYKGGIKEYERLEKAMKIHREAAWKSASWGMFQVMGFNHEACGYRNITEFVEGMSKHERAQLEAFACFVRANRMVDYLKNKNWADFARCYNGPEYKQNRYDEKLEAAYQKFKSRI